MFIDHCGPDIFMAQELLHRSDVISILQEMPSKAVAEWIIQWSYTTYPGSNYLDDGSVV
jgi:hypothetical protein